MSVLQSADFPSGLSSFADWRAFAEAADGRAGAAYTASLTFGLVPLGFMVVLLPKPSRPAANGKRASPLADQARADELSVLARSLSAAVGLSRLRAHSTASLSARSSSSLSLAVRSGGGSGSGAHRAGGRGRSIEGGHRNLSSSSLRCPIPGRSELDDDGPGFFPISPSALSGGGGDGGGDGASSSESFSAYWPCVTVVFADVVNFTAMTSGQEPNETMELLNHLFHLFDSLTLSHGVYKVETVGDTVRRYFVFSRFRVPPRRCAVAFALL